MASVDSGCVRVGRLPCRLTETSVQTGRVERYIGSGRHSKHRFGRKWGETVKTGLTRVGNYTWCYRLSTGEGWGHHGRMKSGAKTGNRCTGR